MVDTTNLNGKTWLNEGGEIVSYAEHVVERFTPAGPDTIQLPGDRHRSGGLHAAMDHRFPDQARERHELSRGGLPRRRSRPAAPEGPERRGGQEEIGLGSASNATP